VNSGTVSLLTFERYSKLMKSARVEYRALEDTYKRLNDHDIKEFYDFEEVIIKMEELATTIDNYDYFLGDLESMAEENRNRMNFISISGSNNQVVENVSNSTVINNADFTSLKECENALNDILVLKNLISEQMGSKADEMLQLLNDVSDSIDKKESSSKTREILRKLCTFCESVGAGVIGNLISAVLVKHGIFPTS